VSSANLSESVLSSTSSFRYLKSRSFRCRFHCKNVCPKPEMELVLASMSESCFVGSADCVGRGSRTTLQRITKRIDRPVFCWCATPNRMSSRALDCHFQGPARRANRPRERQGCETRNALAILIGSFGILAPPTLFQLRHTKPTSRNPWVIEGPAVNYVVFIEMDQQQSTQLLLLRRLDETFGTGGITNSLRFATIFIRIQAKR